MLELDHILARFLDRDYAAAPDPVRAAFETFLALEDPDMMDLLTGRVAAPELANLLALLRRPD